jgi:H+/gluconate symporter-like permease
MPFGSLDSASVIVNAIIILIGVICTLLYFFFSKEHKGVLGGVSRVGIIYLMIGFGAAFGYTVMSRISLLIGRIDFLLNLPLIRSLLPQ